MTKLPLRCNHSADMFHSLLSLFQQHCPKYFFKESIVISFVEQYHPPKIYFCIFNPWPHKWQKSCHLQVQSRWICVSIGTDMYLYIWEAPASHAWNSLCLLCTLRRSAIFSGAQPLTFLAQRSHHLSIQNYPELLQCHIVTPSVCTSHRWHWIWVWP